MKRRGFELRGESTTVLTLYLYDQKPDALAQFLKRKRQEAPSFFRGAPLVIDGSALALESEEIEAIASVCRRLGFLPIGWRSQDPEQQAKARAVGLFPFGRSERRPAKPHPSPASTLIVEEPVRSGQRIYSRGDLIVTSAVNPGGEVIAEGNVHVYGPLRGRAMAGAGGDETRRIFCRRLDAELVAIAGHYLLHEDFPPDLLGQSVQILFKGDHLRLEPI